jgi:transcriptional regulator of heat shock response
LPAASWRRDRADLDEAARGLVERGLASWSADASERPVLIVRGQANLIDEHASADLERVRQLLEDLEGKQEISRLMEGRDARPSPPKSSSDRKTSSFPCPVLRS